MRQELVAATYHLDVELLSMQTSESKRCHQTVFSKYLMHVVTRSMLVRAIVPVNRRNETLQPQTEVSSGHLTVIRVVRICVQPQRCPNGSIGLSSTIDATTRQMLGHVGLFVFFDILGMPAGVSNFFAQLGCESHPSNPLMSRIS
jgi:hypothetical protein